MMQPILELPEKINEAIFSLLQNDEKRMWVHRAESLHERYFQRDETKLGESIIQDKIDALAYLALRVPATYAQVIGALNHVKEQIPDWEPQRVLDIGSGPGTSIQVAEAIVGYTAVAAHTDVPGPEPISKTRCGSQSGIALYVVKSSNYLCICSRYA